MGFISFFSDYVVASGVHFGMPLRRRAFALDLLVIYVYLSTITVNMFRLGTVTDALSIVVLMALGALVVLEWSGRSSGPAQWEFRHTMWHVYLVWLGFKMHEVMYGPTPGAPPCLHLALWPAVDPLPAGIGIAAVLVVGGGMALTVATDALAGRFGAAEGAWYRVGLFEWWRARRGPLQSGICRSAHWNGG